MNLKTGYSAQELADLQLNSLPQTRPGVTHRAKKDCWITRKRAGRGGGTEYLFESLPADAQAEIKAKAYKALVNVSPKAGRGVAVIANRSIDTLDSDQRATADARLMMTLLVAKYVASTGSRTKAM